MYYRISYVSFSVSRLNFGNILILIARAISKKIKLFDRGRDHESDLFNWLVMMWSPLLHHCVIIVVEHANETCYPNGPTIFGIGQFLLFHDYQLSSELEQLSFQANSWTWLRVEPVRCYVCHPPTLEKQIRTHFSLFLSNSPSESSSDAGWCTNDFHHFCTFHDQAGFYTLKFHIHTMKFICADAQMPPELTSCTLVWLRPPPDT